MRFFSLVLWYDIGKRRLDDRIGAGLLRGMADNERSKRWQ